MADEIDSIKYSEKKHKNSPAVKISENPVKYLKSLILTADEMILDKKFHLAIDVLREGEEIYDVYYSLLFL